MAQRHAWTHLAFAVAVMFVIMLGIMLNQDAVSGLFTTDETDIYYINEVMDIIAIYLMLDAVHGVNTGIVRALGK